MSRSPRVSVVMAAHNAAATIAASVRSVLRQTLSDLELIVIDDASNDATAHVATATADGDPRFRLLRQETRSERSAARNRGIRAATSELIGILDADDVALPERFERQVEFMDAHPEVALLGGWGWETDTAGHLTALLRPPTDDAALRRAMRRRSPFIHSATIYRKAAALEAGLYDPRLTASEDTDLFFRILRSAPAAVLPEPLVVRRVDWRAERRSSRERRLRSLRTRWTWRRESGAASPVGVARFGADLLRLALPSALDVRLRRLKRRLDPPPAMPPHVRRWIEACRRS